MHGCNLGVPGNIETTLATIRAAEGLPLHLTHIQFHSYGTEGDRNFSSGAAQIAELVNKSPNISIDVGQILFGQTCTASGDSMRQYGNTRSASPKKWVVMDIECDAGCGVIPMRYRDKSFVNALQWAIGLEMFLLVEDPWRVFPPPITERRAVHDLSAPDPAVDGPSFRNDMLQKINPDAAAASIVGSLDREYALRDRDHDAGPGRRAAWAKGSRPPRAGRLGRHHGLRGQLREAMLPRRCSCSRTAS